MGNWSTIFGILLVLFAAYSVYRGRIDVSSKNDRTSSWITRTDNPVLFWICIVVILVLAAVLGFNVYNF